MVPWFYVDYTQVFSIPELGLVAGSTRKADSVLLAQSSPIRNKLHDAASAVLGNDMDHDHSHGSGLEHDHSQCSHDSHNRGSDGFIDNEDEQ